MENTEQDYSKPVAYTADGQPLYAHPPQASPQPQVVHLARSREPVAEDISPQVQAKHDQSKRYFPWLNLSAGEFIISAVRRHPIGLVPIVGFMLLMLLIFWAIVPFYHDYATAPTTTAAVPATEVIVMIVTLLSILVIIGSFAAMYIYLHNRFFLTNESVIQEIQVSLFSRHEQTVSLANIEDASFYQTSLLQTIFNYGTIRLSTEGDETTYRFTYVANPKKEIATLNNAVEAFKNGRPVGED